MIKSAFVAATALTVFAGTSASAVVSYTGSVAPTGNYGDVSAASGPSADGYNFISGVDDGGTFDNAGGTLDGSIGLAPTDHLFITLRVNSGNANTFMRVLLLEEDDGLAGSASGEAFGYDVDLASQPIGSFVTLDLGELSTAFDIGPNGAFGRAPGDLAWNIDAGTGLGLYEVQLQTTFTGNPANAIDVTVGEVFVAVPEPASLGLLAAGAGLIGLRRRR